jgi:hypothetical protein
MINQDGTGRFRITDLGYTPIRLLPFPESEWVYWQEGTVSGRNVYEGGTFQTRIDGSEQKTMDIPEFIIAPTGDFLVYCCFIITRTDGTPVTEIKQSEVKEVIKEVKWSPDGTKIAFTVEAADRYILYVWTISSSSPVEYPAELFDAPYFNIESWSPDSQNLIIDYYQNGPMAINIETMTRQPLLEAINWINWIAIPFSVSIVWIP